MGLLCGTDGPQFESELRSQSQGYLTLESVRGAHPGIRQPDPRPIWKYVPIEHCFLNWKVDDSSWNAADNIGQKVVTCVRMLCFGASITTTTSRLSSGNKSKTHIIEFFMLWVTASS